MTPSVAPACWSPAAWSPPGRRAPCSSAARHDRAGPRPCRAGTPRGSGGDPAARGHRRPVRAARHRAERRRPDRFRLTVLLVLALLLILASGLQRRPQGLLIGTVLQVPLLLTGLFSSAMWLGGGVLGLIWAYLLQVRKELLGSPFGPAPQAPPSPPENDVR